MVEPFASLVQLLSDDAHIGSASGVKMESVVELFIDNQNVQRSRRCTFYGVWTFRFCYFWILVEKASYAFTKGQTVHASLDLFPHLKDIARTFAKEDGICKRKVAFFVA